ncbi:hypothetical protein [Nocardiopsis potens]|uniref:hypothetical protein n=1 Tax=Nocardiopsis potens TaxID=1246458 RepID=UPI0003472BC1|nr:hypothetical protein [Nocardiopsis potens]
MSDARYPLAVAVPRAAMFAAVCTAVALLGHVAAGAPGPDAGVFAAAWAGLTLLGTPPARAPRSAPALIAGVLGAQLLLHLFFTLAAGPLPAGGLLPAAEHMCSGGAEHGGGTGMLAAHLWAALVTGWWLAGGEEALWTLLHRLRAALDAPPAAPAPLLAAPAARALPAPAPGLRPRMLRHALDGRAPPLAPRPLRAAR